MRTRNKVLAAIAATSVIVVGALSLTSGSSNLVPVEVALFSDTATPAHPNSNDTSSIEVGVKFTVDTPGLITGMEFMKGADDKFAEHTGRLWDSSGNKLISSVFADETTSGLQKVYFRERISAKPGITYIVSFGDPQGHYAADVGGFAKPLDKSPLHAPVNAGVFSTTVGSYPNQTFGNTNYWVSPIFAPAAVVSLSTTTTIEPPSTSTSSTTTLVPTTNPSTTTTPIGFTVRDANNTGTHINLHGCPAGDVVVPGTVLDGCDINGNMGILADYVTIKNSRIHGFVRIGRSANGGGDRNVQSPIIVDTDIIGSGDGSGINGVRDVDGIYQRNNLYNWENCMTMWVSTRARVLDSYCHDPKAGPTAHLDGFEIYDIKGGIIITGNTIYQTVEQNAAAPLNLTPTGDNFTGTVWVENNLLRSANPVYVILADDSQGPGGIVAVFNNNKFWPDNSTNYFSLRNTTGKSRYSGSGNSNWLTGQPVSCC